MDATTRGGARLLPHAPLTPVHIYEGAFGNAVLAQIQTDVQLPRQLSIHNMYVFDTS